VHQHRPDAAADLVEGRGTGAGAGAHDEVLHRGRGAETDDESLGLEESEVGCTQVTVRQRLGEDVHAGLGGCLHHSSCDHRPVVWT
jgi:hypothetical protein